MPESNERRRERYRDDPEYRERKKSQSRSSRARNPSRPRSATSRANDAARQRTPEWRAYAREWRRERRATNPSADVESRARYEASGKRPPRRRDDATRLAAYSDRERRRREVALADPSRNNQHYTPEEDAVLLDASLSRLEVALTLGRSLSSIDYRRAHLRRLAA